MTSIDETVHSWEWRSLHKKPCRDFAEQKCNTQPEKCYLSSLADLPQKFSNLWQIHYCRVLSPSTICWGLSLLNFQLDNTEKLSPWLCCNTKIITRKSCHQINLIRDYHLPFQPKKRDYCGSLPLIGMPPKFVWLIEFENRRPYVPKSYN